MRIVRSIADVRAAVRDARADGRPGRTGADDGRVPRGASLADPAGPRRERPGRRLAVRQPDAVRRERGPGRVPARRGARCRARRRGGRRHPVRPAGRGDLPGRLRHQHPRLGHHRGAVRCAPRTRPLRRRRDGRHEAVPDRRARRGLLRAEGCAAGAGDPSPRARPRHPGAHRRLPDRARAGRPGDELPQRLPRPGVPPAGDRAEPRAGCRRRRRSPRARRTRGAVLDAARTVLAACRHRTRVPRAAIPRRPARTRRRRRRGAARGRRAGRSGATHRQPNPGGRRHEHPTRLPRRAGRAPARDDREPRRAEGERRADRDGHRVRLPERADRRGRRGRRRARRRLRRDDGARPREHGARHRRRDAHAHRRRPPRAVAPRCWSPTCPFGSYEVSDEQAVATAQRFIKTTGCDAVKIERGGSSVDRARAIIAAGIPVMGHVGLTPQTAATIGGYRSQGRTAEEALAVCESALALQAAGCFAIVFEAIPTAVTDAIMPRLRRPGDRHRRRSRHRRPGARVPRHHRPLRRPRRPLREALRRPAHRHGRRRHRVHRRGAHARVPAAPARLRDAGRKRPRGCGRSSTPGARREPSARSGGGSTRRSHRAAPGAAPRGGTRCGCGSRLGSVGRLRCPDRPDRRAPSLRSACPGRSGRRRRSPS